MHVLLDPLQLISRCLVTQNINSFAKINKQRGKQKMKLKQQTVFVSGQFHC